MQHRIGRRLWRGLAAALCATALAASLGCGGSQSEAEEAKTATPPLPSLAETYGQGESEEAEEEGALDVGKWPDSTRSPHPMAAVSAQDVPLYRSCGEPDRALSLVASRVLARRMDGEAPYSPRELELLLRARGVPQIWPRALTIAGLEDGEALELSLIHI